MKNMAVYINESITRFLGDEEILAWLKSTLHMQSDDKLYCNFINNDTLAAFNSEQLDEWGDEPSFFSGIGIIEYQFGMSVGIHINLCLTAMFSSEGDIWEDMVTKLKDAVMYIEFPFDLYDKMCDRYNVEKMSQEDFKVRSTNLMDLVLRMNQMTDTGHIH